MNNIDYIFQHELFIKYQDIIDKAEKDRQFCLHGIEHSIDVARISYIINLEEALGYNKDAIYAMALLHDLGRAFEYESGINHHKAGADIARQILEGTDIKDKIKEEICTAIAEHKNVLTDGEKKLSYILYKADKLSRDCFNCKAYDECYWDEELKNKTIRY